MAKNFYAEHKVALSIFSETITAVDITQRLNIQPTKTGEKGELTSKNSSKKRDSSAWFLELDSVKNSSFEEQIEELIVIIESRIPEFQELSQHSKIELFCGFFPQSLEHDGCFFLDSNTLKRLTVVPVDIMVILYPPLDD